MQRHDLFLSENLSIQCSYNFRHPWLWHWATATIRTRRPTATILTPTSIIVRNSSTIWFNRGSVYGVARIISTKLTTVTNQFGSFWPHAQFVGLILFLQIPKLFLINCSRNRLIYEKPRVKFLSFCLLLYNYISNTYTIWKTITRYFGKSYLGISDKFSIGP